MSARRDPAVDLALAREHGLTDEEYANILEILGRTPTFPELGIFSVMWSEHCSYKSSKRYLRELPTRAERNAFYTALGRRVPPAKVGLQCLRRVTVSAPGTILAAL